MSRRVFAVAAVCFALAVGVLTIVSSRRAGLVPSAPADPAPGSRPTSGARAPAPDPPAAAPRPARRPTPAPESRAEPEPVPEEAPLELGTLRIEADVPGAQVFIDRQFIGTAPLTAENVKPGTHQLNVTAEGFEGIAQTIDVEPGPRELSFRFREIRLDAALAVVHRHRIGSCQGLLVATAEGVRYETANREDGFSAPLSELETFQVDYQEKNLRIKVRNGRQFNFTDPDGNADRLFVFHRDVEKVRAMLEQ